MIMHWGKTLENKRLGLAFKTSSHDNQSLGGFPYNRTEYELSQEKVAWDQIWIAAFNQSSQQQNRSSSSYANNHFMKKTRLLSDMIGNQTHPHSFTMVMVIASLFLFITLAMTVAVVVFCRKKNAVFVFQKSEQEDGDYELDDMDTNTDLEYVSDNEDEEGSPNKQYGQYLHVQNPTSFRPRMTCNGCSDQDQPSPHPSPIYKPKRPLQQDSRGAYQPVKLKASVELHSQGNGENCTGETRKGYSGFFRKLSKKWSNTSNKRRSSSGENINTYTKHIPVILVSDVESDSGACHQLNHHGNMKDSGNIPKTTYQNAVPETNPSPVQSCDRYNTQVTLAHTKSVSNGDHVIQLAGITSSHVPERFGEHNDSPEYGRSSSPPNDGEEDRLITNCETSTPGTAIKDLKPGHCHNGGALYDRQMAQTDTFYSPSLHSLHTSPVKESMIKHNGCHSVPTTPGQNCTPALVLSSTVPSKKHWVTFDDRVI